MALQVEKYTSYISASETTDWKGVLKREQYGSVFKTRVEHVFSLSLLPSDNIQMLQNLTKNED